MKSATDTSSISFTAHYTGFVWYKNQLSNDAFITNQGKTYYQLLRPFEFLARHIIGSDIRTTLLQRHHLLDHELSKLIDQHPDLQILEIACGLSPRGYRYIKAFPSIRYIEADLHSMAKRKAELLAPLNTLSERHRVITCNILENGDDSLENVIANEFDHSKPIAVITEGLVNYFDLETISIFWQRLSELLAKFPSGHYLTDIYPSVKTHKFAKLIRLSNETLRIASRSRFSLHFETDQQMQAHFLKMGFQHAQVFNPDTLSSDASIPHAKGGSIVRVVHAST